MNRGSGFCALAFRRLGSGIFGLTGIVKTLAITVTTSKDIQMPMKALTRGDDKLKINLLFLRQVAPFSILHHHLRPSALLFLS